MRGTCECSVMPGMVFTSLQHRPVLGEEEVDPRDPRAAECLEHRHGGVPRAPWRPGRRGAPGPGGRRGRRTWRRSRTDPSPTISRAGDASSEPSARRRTATSSSRPTTTSSTRARESRARASRERGDEGRRRPAPGSRRGSTRPRPASPRPGEHHGGRLAVAEVTRRAREPWRCRGPGRRASWPTCPWPARRRRRRSRRRGRRPARRARRACRPHRAVRARAGTPRRSDAAI